MNNKVNDMMDMMSDGWGLDVDSFKNHYLDIIINVNREGGSDAILSGSKGFCAVAQKMAHIVSTIRMLADDEGLIEYFDGIKTTDILNVEFRYMESEETAGFHFIATQKETGNAIVDKVVETVIDAVTGKMTTKKL
jgi:hypothetical protein